MADGMLPEATGFLAHLAILLVGGAVVLVVTGRAWQHEWRALGRNRGVPAGQPGWSDIILYVWLLLTGTLLLQQGLVFLFGPPPPADGPPELHRAIAMGAAMQAGLLLATFLFWRFPLSGQAERPRYGEAGWGRVVRQAVLAFLASYPLIWAVGLVWGMLLFQFEAWGWDLPLKPQDVAELLADDPPWPALAALLFLALLVAPVVEEIIFRGTLYPLLKARIGPRLAMLVAGTLFALVHFHLLGLPALVFVGIVLGLVYERYQDLRVAMVFHFLFNLNAVAMLLWIVHG